MEDFTQEGFSFAGYHTGEFELILLERSAPSPAEKQITESVPFMQGIYDFSLILGERIYENRPLSFKFTYFQDEYEKRKVDETVLTNWLMRGGYQPLYDDHARDYYYLAKCTLVQVEDDTAGRRLNINLSFDAYPFKLSALPEGHGLWDNFNFDLDYSQDTEYTVNGSLSINLMNVGSTGVTPIIIASAAMTIIKDGITYAIPAGETKSESFRLAIGENPMMVNGNGVIKFTFYKELI